ncbi:AAA family ATPase [Pedobacter puniceum]|uniref:Rad50/SbcC-type AAA domain-containing protein n=1 Tax=Pedobacter puniceum TaxID=2666136 RepID=A0A7K0FL81_9SPHI|nr:AAA family ATPase [Pedobacter puniceum]MRX46562.1 hypothetical protein [Pedobacter puniceum]
MRLAAIYIEEHEYLFEEPQTINFGGQYFYEFENQDSDILVTKTLNENFIPDFFNLTNLASKVTNLNAIVGQNGAGKSTLLDLIRSEFIGHEYALSKSNSLFLIELEGAEDPIILRNDFDKIFIKTTNKKASLKELKSELPSKPQTIYYSPHYDYKYNPNFDDIDNHDISFDKIVENDLEEMRDKDTNENGWPYSASQELIFKNSLRQITFLSSDLVKTQNIFKDLFQLQEHYEPILHFRGYNDKEKEWNTPYQLRAILKSIADKAEKESSDWHLIRKFEKDKVLNQVEINQYLLKRNVIKCILSLLYRQMERKNSFLQEGFFPYEELKLELELADAYQTLILFAKHSSITPKSTKSEKIFSDGIFEEFLTKIYSAIEKTTDKDSVSNGTLKASTEDAIEILRFQRQFLNELNTYYVKFYSNKDELTVEEREKIEEFINYMPFSRRMSSGENALLNFYSRIYDFLNTNLKEIKYRKLKKHYILLLDEADLTFHLSWKKKYVKALLKTLPFFFNELENNPSIEIIFTTHDPITLSDLPNANVIYIERQDYNSPSNILAFNSKNRPSKTFGANISDLIADSFFIEDSLIGDFAFDKIQETIVWLNNRDNHQNESYYKKIIKTIDEPIIQRKLAEMYDDKTNENFQLEVLNEQIKKLEELKKRIQE